MRTNSQLIVSDAAYKGLTGVTTVGGTKMSFSEIAETLISSERMFTNEVRSDLTELHNKFVWAGNAVWLW